MRLKFSKQYPRKFSLPGHNIQQMVIDHTIQPKYFIGKSEYKQRDIYKTDHLTHEVIAVVSATVSAFNDVGRILTVYKKSY